jgi:hypothetical protein
MPLESFDLVNGRIESKQSPTESIVQGVHYSSCQVVATLHKLWDRAEAAAELCKARDLAPPRSELAASIERELGEPFP